MNYRQVIAESWSFTQKNKRLILWYGCIPALFEIVSGIGFIVYQYFAFKKSELFDYHGPSFLSELFSFGWNFFKTDVGRGVILLIVAGLGILLYLALPTLLQCAAVQYIARRRNKQEATLGDGMRHGVFSFLPVLEYHAMIKIFAFFWLLSEAAFVLRNLGMDAFQFLGPVFFIVFLFGLLLSLLFTYTVFYIIIDGKNVMKSIGLSIKLVILNWTHTFLITVLMLIIGVRIVIQLIIVLSIPAITLLLGGYLATTMLAGVGYILAGILGVIALIFAVYLSGIIEIFSNTVWTFTFLELTEKGEISARERDVEKTVGARHVMIENDSPNVDELQE
jgi:hypothetical protein